MPQKRVMIPLGAAVAGSAIAGVGDRAAYAVDDQPVSPDQDQSQIPVDQTIGETVVPNQPVESPPAPDGYDSMLQVHSLGTSLESVAARFDVDIDLLTQLNPDPNASMFFVPARSDTLMRNPRPDTAFVDAADLNTQTHGFSAVSSEGGAKPSYAAFSSPSIEAATDEEDKGAVETVIDAMSRFAAFVVLEANDKIFDRVEKPADTTQPASDAHVPPNVAIRSSGFVTVTIDGQTVQFDPHNSTSHITNESGALPVANVVTYDPIASETPPSQPEQRQTISSYSDVLASMPAFEDLPEVKSLQSVNVYAPDGLRTRSAAYQQKVTWLSETTASYITPEAFFAFATDGIDKTLAQKDIFASERSSRTLSGKCVVLHWMGGKAPDAEAAARAMLNRDVIASANYFLMSDGKLAQAIPNDFGVAYHAGAELNYDCWGIEIEGFDALDFTPQSHLSIVNWVVYKHRVQGMALERNIAAIEALGFDSYNDYATSNVPDDSIFGTVKGHKEAPQARGKQDPLSSYVNLVFEDAVRLNAAIDAYLAVHPDGPPQGEAMGFQNPEAEYSHGNSLKGIETNSEGEHLLTINSPLNRPFVVNDSHNMYRGEDYAGIIENAYYQQGWDVKAALGEQVYAPITGKIHLFPDAGGMGKVVMLQADEGMFIQLGHLQGFVDGIEHGQMVEIGDHIAFVGMSGRATGPHLDIKMGVFTGEPRPFSLAQGEGFKSVNPANYFDLAYITFRYGPNDGHGVVGMDDGVNERLRLRLLDEYAQLVGTVPTPSPVETPPPVAPLVGPTTPQEEYIVEAVQAPVVMSAEEYKLLQRASVDLTGSADNVSRLFAPQRQVITGFRQHPLQPENPVAPTTPPTPPPAIANSGGREVTFAFNENWQQDLRKAKENLDNARFQLLLTVYSSFVELQNEGYDINPVVATAQVIGESGLGTSELALKANNLLGHGTSKDDPDAYWTWDNGNWRPFKRFPSIKDGLRGYAERISTGTAYPDAARCHDSITAYLLGLQNTLSDEDCSTIVGAHGTEGVMSYAEDPEYIEKLRSIIKSYGLADVVVVIDKETGQARLASSEGGLFTA